jgi:hypothetical protein
MTAGYRAHAGSHSGNRTAAQSSRLSSGCLTEEMKHDYNAVVAVSGSFRYLLQGVIKVCRMQSPPESSLVHNICKKLRIHSQTANVLT